MDTISSSTFQVPTKNGKNHCVTVEALHNGYLVAVVGRWPLYTCFKYLCAVCGGREEGGSTMFILPSLWPLYPIMII